MALNSVLAVIDAVDGPHHTVFMTLLVIGPFLASARSRPVPTALVGLYSLALGVVLGSADHIFGQAPHLEKLTVIAVGSVAATWLAVTGRRREATLAGVRRVAEAAQRAILRPVPACVGSLRVASRYVSATQEARVGGDFYDVAVTAYGLRAVMGDIKGKGLDAVRLAATALGAFREAAHTQADLAAVARAMDASIARDAGEEDFATAVLIQFRDPGTVVVVNCGHLPPLRIGAAGSSLLQSPTSALPLGLGSRPQPDSHAIRPGERLLCYTDGLIEARDGTGREFDLMAIAGQAVGPGQGLEEALDQLLGRVRAHAGGDVGDDIALLVLELQTADVGRASAPGDQDTARLADGTARLADGTARPVALNLRPFYARLLHANGRVGRSG